MRQKTTGLLAAVMTTFVAANAISYDAPSFVNYETPHVSPISTTPDGTKLLVVNTADDRLMVFSLGADNLSCRSQFWSVSTR
jgi:6-phosphogluconolactonase (cycloisomerase 2 family)